jgi:stage V sporulation protein R
MQRQVEEAARSAGLDFFDTRFILVNTRTLNEVALMAVFHRATRTGAFGMEYDRLSKSSRYGLSKIYELVNQ